MRQKPSFRVGKPLSPTTPDLLLARPRDVIGHSPVSHLAKVLPPGSSAKRKVRFEHQRQLLLGFSHANIPTVVESGDDYFILEYVLGVDLSQLLARPGLALAIDSEVAIYILGQLAEALHYIHEFELPNATKDDFVRFPVVHRNVCPSQVLLSVEGDVLLTGFSSAHSPMLPQDCVAMESLENYHAPELASGSISPVSDVYSLAVLFWEMLSGKRFSREKYPDLPSRRLLGPASEKVREIVRVDLSDEPERRHESAYRIIQRICRSPEAAEAPRARQKLGELVCAAFDAGAP